MNSINHIKDDAVNLESLLRQYLLLENETDLLKQKTMNMTAEIVFSSDALRIPTLQKGNEMLRKLHKDFTNGSSVGWLLIAILTTLIGGLAGYFYLNRTLISEDVQNSLVTRVQHAETTKPSVKAEPVKKTTALYDANYIQIPDKKNNNLQIASKTRSDTLKKKVVKHAKNSLMPENKAEMVSTYPISLSPAPDWNKYGSKMIETPKKYLKKSASFIIDTSWNYWFVKQNVITHDYYHGEPFKKTPDDLIYINYGDFLQMADRSDLKNVQLPMASRFYLDSQDTKLNLYDYHVSKVPETALRQILLPFYFRRYEVTNREFREFLIWVSRQNGYQDYHSGYKTLADIKKAFSYTFFNPNISGLKDLPSSTINVFPDTTSFIRDFPFSKTDRMVHVYFTDQAYNDYPICGVNYWQAMAYLDWKTKSYQDYLDQNHIPYLVSFELPSDIEWEMAAKLNKYPASSLQAYNPITDNNWITSLCFSIQNGTEKFKALDNMLNNNVIYEGNWVEDGYLYPGPGDLEQGKNKRYIKNGPAKIHLAPSGISWMDGNVSEWMQETYAQNWLPMYQKHQNYLMKRGGEDDLLLIQIEKYFNKRNDTDGQLVRGGNFYDERYSDILNKNLAGIMLKRFVSPNDEYSTIGFRYVLRVVAKQ